MADKSLATATEPARTDPESKGPGRTVVTTFLDDLRKLREEAGGPSFRTMTRTAHYSHTALSGVLSGGRLPSRELTLAFVKACGGDQGMWRDRWQRVYEQVNGPSPAAAVPRWSPRRLTLVAFATGVALAAVSTVVVLGIRGRIRIG